MNLSNYFSKELFDLITHVEQVDCFSKALESETDFKFSLDMPGVKKEDIKIELKKNTLCISAERKNRKYQKSLYLSSSVDLEQIQAKYEDGVLYVCLPKNVSVKAKTIKVE